MRAIDAALLGEIAQGGNGTLVAALAPELQKQLAVGGIDTPLRTAHFLAQAVYETWYLRRIEEDLDYPAARIVSEWPRLFGRGTALAHDPEALANAAYADMLGNGDEASRDGWTYRGRGLFMLTGRENYALYGCGGDPDFLATPQGAVRSAIAFWHGRGIERAADDDDTPAVTRLVSGSGATTTARTLLKARALRLLSGD